MDRDCQQELNHGTSRYHDNQSVNEQYKAFLQQTSELFARSQTYSKPDTQNIQFSQPNSEPNNTNMQMNQPYSDYESSTSVPLNEFDTSGFSTEAALIDTMNTLKLSDRERKSPITVLSEQLFMVQQQQLQQASLQQNLNQEKQQLAQHRQQQQLIEYQTQQAQAQQQANAVSNMLALPSTDQIIGNRISGPILSPSMIDNHHEPYAADRVVKLHHSVAAMCEATCTWNGQIPPKNYNNPTSFSCKVFVGAVPWDITEAGLHAAFDKFGNVKIEWPNSFGYVFLLFEYEQSVRSLLQECTQDFRTGGYYYNIVSLGEKSKRVQVVPWMIRDSKCGVRPLDGKQTVFIGGLHGMISAETLFIIMNDLFGNVVYAGIDYDRLMYPIGSGRATFSSKLSYMKAIQAAFVEIKTHKFAKTVQIDPYLQDSYCSVCRLEMGPYFCKDLQCLKYYCRTCWYWKHEQVALMYHQPIGRNANGHACLAVL